MFWYDSDNSMVLKRILSTAPMAIANMSGDTAHKEIEGNVSFYPALGGTLVLVDIAGLPITDGNCPVHFYAVHIHEGSECGSNDGDGPFSLAGGHYNPNNCMHPMHAGDLPPIFSVDGFAWGAFYTENVSVPEIIGKTFIIHALPDDFHTQPSGNSGSKIACGEIKMFNSDL